MSDVLIRTERRGKVAVVALDRPSAHNALSDALVTDLTLTLDAIESDDDVSVAILTGGEEVFASGADVREMAELDQATVFARDFSGCCTALADFRKPVIAAVAGPALGGGCELVEMCDIVVAARSARFGHPEVRLGTMPGAGGTQRLPRLLGKHKAMDLLLTGRTINAEEAERLGLVSRLAEDGEAVATAMEIADELARQSRPVLMKIKEAVNHSFRAPLPEGVRHERRLFHMTFSTHDREEGMRAFLDKRQPRFRNR